ncbi:hypothetical protein [Riemerella anatipestifer]|uniref:hypothetical protein n=1 Tax=Riemerella anatipestifer TaxID=34085 RepID=UPI00129D52AE|nr:hypothetical protein [Riemerella anatipestifer]MRM83038.1 hypothetical protein [Riemerella anatipestifer]
MKTIIHYISIFILVISCQDRKKNQDFMDILKSTKVLFLILLILFSCREIPRTRSEAEHKTIVLRNWDLKKFPIHKVSLKSYQKGSDFTIQELEFMLDSVADAKYNEAIYLEFYAKMPMDKDYKLTINDSVLYMIKDIETSYVITPYMPSAIDSTYNMIKSLNINGKEYIFEQPRVFQIPKEALNKGIVF